MRTTLSPRADSILISLPKKRGEISD